MNTNNIIEMQKGNRNWTVKIKNGTNSSALVIYNWGFVSKKQTIKEVIYNSGKNIGKANETTPYEQALKEVFSNVKRKADKGYFLTYATDKELFNSIITPDTFKPMLASKLKPSMRNKLKTSPFQMQPKLDGVRCIAIYKDDKVCLYSRSGNQFKLLKHIEKKLNFLKDYEGLVLDGELYLHELNFQDIISAIKKKNFNTKLLEFHVFDCYSSNSSLKAHSIFSTRLNFLKKIEAKNNFKLVEAVNAKYYQIDNIYKSYLNEGYEGTVIRILNNSVYSQNKRSEYVLKYKPIDDAEFKIVDYKSEILTNGKNGIVYTCITPENKKFNVRPAGNMEERELEALKVLDNIGKQYTVEFQGLTLDGIPRFPVGKGFRYSS